MTHPVLFHHVILNVFAVIGVLVFIYFNIRVVATIRHQWRLRRDT